jgi:hypothetical protein
MDAWANFRKFAAISDSEKGSGNLPVIPHQVPQAVIFLMLETT